MSINLLMQNAGQGVQEVPLSILTSNTFVQAEPAARLALNHQAGDISSMTRSGDKLFINTSNGKTIEISHFFGADQENMTSLTLIDTDTGEKKFVLGDEKLYADGETVTAYTSDELRNVVAGNEYYEQRAAEGAEAAEEEGDDNTALLVGLGLGGLALAGIAIALANDSDDNGSSYTAPTDPGTTDPGTTDPGTTDPGTTDPLPSSLTMNLSNGTMLEGTTDVAGARIYIDVDGDGVADYTVTTDADGKWSLTPETPFTDAQNITAWAQNDADEKILEISITIDANSPDITELNVSQALDELSGITEANATVTLDVDGDGVVDYTVVADADGRYTINLAADAAQLLPGVSVVEMTDAVGNTTTLTLPANDTATLLGISNGTGVIQLTDTTVLSEPTLHGRGVPGTDVVILSNGEAAGTAVVGANGMWQVTLSGLKAGQNTFTLAETKPIAATSSTHAEGKTGSVTYQGSDNTLTLVSADALVRETEGNDAIDTAQSITRALPTGGYLVAYAEAESAGSKFYDIKIKIYDDAGQLVNTLTVGQQGTVDGYAVTQGQAGLSNFDVSVSPVDGAITVFYASGQKGDLEYTGTSAVYERFTANGTAITDGPQVVNAHYDAGGLGGLLDGIIGNDFSNLVTKVVDGIWSPISALFSPILSFINVDLDGLKTLFVDGISDRIATLFYGHGTMGASIIQMDDGSVVFVGSRYAQFGDPSTIVDRLNIEGFVHDLLAGLGLIEQNNFISTIVEAIYSGVMGLIVNPIASIVDTVLTWFDWDVWTQAASMVYGVQYAPDANGNLVQVTDFNYIQERNVLTAFEQNGYLTGDSDSLFDQIANWVLGKSATSSDSLGLDGTQVSDSTYAVVWQSAKVSETLSNVLSLPISTKLALVDATTGQTVSSEIVLDRVSGTHSVAPQVNTLADGTVLVTWVAVSNRDAGDVYAQRFSVVGNKLVAQTEAYRVNASSDGTQGLIYGSLKEAYDVTVLENGSYLVSWNSTTSNGAQGVVGQMYDVNNNVIGGELLLASSATSMLTESSITALTDGGFVVNWTEQAEGGGNMYHSVYNSDGSIRPAGETASSEAASNITGNFESHLEGTAGNDVIDARTNKTVDAGDGDDYIIIDTTNIVSVDGGAGFDTVSLQNTPALIGSEILSKLSNVEALNLANNEADVLNISYNDLIKLNDNSTLFITGDAADTVDLDLTKWSAAAVGNKGGIDYNLYVYEDDPNAQIWVQSSLAVV